MGALLAAIVQAILAALGFARERQAGRARAEDRTAGGNAAAAKVAVETVDEIQNAVAARAAVERDLALHPDRVFAPDPDERPG